jgi:transcriptional regulator with XRE-family HTH domain
MLTMTTDRKSLAARVRALRLAAGMTQQQLAVAAGLALGGLAQIEQGTTRDPRVSTLRALAKALGVTLDELAGEDDPDAA